MYHKTLNKITSNFVAFGDGGQAHVKITLIFVKSITLIGVIFDIIVIVQLSHTSSL